MKKSVLILALAIAAGLVFYFLKPQTKTDSPSTAVPSKVTLPSTVFLQARVNLNAVLENIKATYPKNKKVASVGQALKMAAGLNLDNIRILLSSNKENLEVIATCQAMPNLIDQFSKTEPFKNFLVKQSEGCWKIDSPELKKKNVSTTALIGQFGTTIVAGDEKSVTKIIAEGKLPSTASLEKFHSSEKLPKDAVISITSLCAEDLEQIYGTVAEPIFQQFKTAMGGGMGGFIIGMVKKSVSKIIEPISELEAFNLQLSLDGENRKVSWKQWCRNPEKISAVYKEISAPGYEAWPKEDMLPELLQACKNNAVTVKHELKDKLFSIDMQWEAATDAKSPKVIAKASIGNLLSRSMASSGQVLSVSQPRPNIFLDSNLTGEKLVAKLPQFLKEATNQQSGYGSVNYKIGNIPMANIELCDIEVAPKSLLTADGRDVLKEEKSKRKNKLYQFFNATHVRMQKLDRKEKVVKALLDFTVKVPEQVEVVTFNSEEVGKTKAALDDKVALMTLKDNMVKIACRDNKYTWKFYAYDKEGNCLRYNSSSRSGAKRTTNFKGLVDTVKVVLFKLSEKETKFTMELPVTEKAQELPEEATEKISPRYAFNEDEFYRDFAAPRRSLSFVKLENRNPSNKQIGIDVDVTGCKFSTEWQVNCFGKNSELTLSNYGSSATKNGRKIPSTYMNKAEELRVAFGNVTLKVRTGMKTIKITKGKIEQFELNGKIIEAKIVKNQVHIKGLDNKTEIMAINAFADNGLLLEKKHFPKTKNDLKIYQIWGQPKSVEVQFSTAEFIKEQSFQLEFANDYDKKAFQNFELLMVDELKMIYTLKQLNKGIRDSNRHSGIPALSGYYYLPKGNKPEPMKAIPKAIADANPRGAALFGYECKSNQGYFFNFCQEIQEQDGRKTNTFKDIYKVNLIKDGKLSTQKMKTVAAFTTIIASPEVIGSKPFYIVNNWGKVYRYTGKGVKNISAIPRNLWNHKDWKEVSK